jgi:hypothetical protein
VLRGIDSNSDSDCHAAVLAAQAARRWLQQAAEEVADSEKEAAADHFAGKVDVLITAGHVDPAALTTMANTAAWIYLFKLPEREAAAQRVLVTALEAAEEAGSPTLLETQGLLLLSLARQPGREDDLSRVLEELGPLPAEQGLPLLESLDQQLEVVGEERAASLAAIQLALIDRIDLEEAGEQAGRDVQLMRANALVALGNGDEARHQLKTLAAQYPDDGLVQRRYAKRLLESGPSHLPAALDHWRLIGRRSAPGTEGWWQARYHVALALHRLGRDEEAARVIQYLQVTTNWPDEPTQQRFETLLQQTR